MQPQDHFARPSPSPTLQQQHQQQQQQQQQHYLPHHHSVPTQYYPSPLVTPFPQLHFQPQPQHFVPDHYAMQSLASLSSDSLGSSGGGGGGGQFPLPMYPFITSGPSPSPPAMQQQTHIHSHSHTSNARNPKEVFVGDLSFFCEEFHLFELFSTYGRVENCRIMKNDTRTKSLMFGFVIMSSEYEAAVVARNINNQLFMGRTIKVEMSDKKPQRTNKFGNNSINRNEIHVSFVSSFPPDKIVKPTEFLLRQFFMKYGPISDVVVREYVAQQTTNRQEGYGFVTFDNVEAALASAQECASVLVEGIIFNCSLNDRVRSNRNMDGGIAWNTTIAQSANVPQFPSLPTAQTALPPHLRHIAVGQSPSPVGDVISNSNSMEFDRSMSWDRSAHSVATSGQSVRSGLQTPQSVDNDDISSIDRSASPAESFGAPQGRIHAQPLRSSSSMARLALQQPSLDENGGSFPTLSISQPTQQQPSAASIDTRIPRSQLRAITRYYPELGVSFEILLPPSHPLCQLTPTTAPSILYDAPSSTT